MKRIEDMTPKQFDRWLYFIATCIFLFCCWLFLSGCSVFKMTETRAAKKIASVEQKQPAVLYNYCSLRFDPVIREHYDTIIREGQVIIDSVTVDCDSVMKVPVITKIVRVPCPPHKTDTVVVTRVLEKENTAKVSALTIERDNAKQDNAVLSAKVHSKNIWLWVLGALAGVMIVWKVANLLKWVGV
jgi:hypothetical protein